MVIDLNPGADTSLVNMAYYSASANAPKDYSKFYKDEADAKAAAYEKTMEASTKMWKDIATAGASIAMEMKANAETYDLMASKATGVGGSEAVTAKIYEIKDGLKNAKLQGIFGTKEQKIEIARLKAEKERLYNQIQFTEDSVKAAAKVINTDNWDVNLSLYDSEMTNAILASVQTNKMTKNNNFAEYGFDEKTGEGMWTLYKTDEETGEKIPATLDDSKTLSITVKQLNESVKNSTKDNGATQKKLDDMVQNAAENGTNSATGEMSDVSLTHYKTQLKHMTDTKSNLNRVMNVQFGGTATSFAEDLKNQSKYSADVYDKLLEATGGNMGHALWRGAQDMDSDGRITLQDFTGETNAANYQILVANILAQTDPEVTREYFIEYALDNFKSEFIHWNNVANEENKAKNKTKRENTTLDEIDKQTLLKFTNFNKNHPGKTPGIEKENGGFTQRELDWYDKIVNINNVR
jgi:hypothetical protein